MRSALIPDSVKLCVRLVYERVLYICTFILQIYFSVGFKLDRELSIGLVLAAYTNDWDPQDMY